MNYIYLKDDCGDASDELNCTTYTRCNFDDNQNPLCNWNDDDDADLYWIRQKGEDADEGYYFPTYDHTSFSEYGYYLRNDINGKVNKTSRLSSPVFYPVTLNEKCNFRFWYYLMGKYDNNQEIIV